jgi:lysophospholipase L1-like esterase
MRTLRLAITAVLLATLGAGCAGQPRAARPTETVATSPVTPGVTTPPIPTPTAPPSGPEWDYVAMGDSYATGYLSGVAYPALFADRIQEEAGAPVRLDNEAVNGLTSGDLAKALEHDDDLRAAISEAEVITWNIGGNDLDEGRVQVLVGSCGGADGQSCVRAAVKRIERNWDRIFKAIVALRSPQEAIVRVVGDYYPYVASDRISGIADKMRQHVGQLSKDLRDLAKRYGVDVADAYLAFNGPSGDDDPIAAGLVGRDGIHPTIAGQQRTADLLAALGYRPLA